ncbi:MAG: hypothetical protein LBK82_11400 [Planctomycetaceae bacterium]|nr:hypothetical protein [Planctomycetaceae bacterium]
MPVKRDNCEAVSGLKWGGQFIKRLRVAYSQNAKRGGQSARWAVAPVESYSSPKRKATPFAVVNLIHCRRVRRRDLSAKGRPPDDCL